MADAGVLAAWKETVADLERREAGCQHCQKLKRLAARNPMPCRAVEFQEGTRTSGVCDAHRMIRFYAVFPPRPC